MGQDEGVMVIPNRRTLVRLILLISTRLRSQVLATRFRKQRISQSSTGIYSSTYQDTQARMTPAVVKRKEIDAQEKQKDGKIPSIVAVGKSSHPQAIAQLS